ncbi:MAG: TldD/PmbA family protein [Candidatus Eremiobacteraeota bacterium]|nr:TldD/PmbA family protein [Candidatus Eremiobacteraeota bacterium]MBV8284692.1 TldD/PmbA family protein [Candidatus Eremiobacteraeota bacterium]MBV8435524.1 TldD/PmbA family protein [Candidatus Eremiobacteraeota bacterium]MBV8655979.1 TldD/PmbA family protein [Candidatus Eremiobacteraeota bacterium]
MTEAQALERAQIAVEMAREAGADAAEATVSVARRFHAEARETTVSKLEQSVGKTLSVRLFVDGRKASLATSDFSERAMRGALERTVAQARFVAADEFAALPDRFAGDCPDLALFDPAIAQRDGEPRVEDALELERLIRSDARIVNSSGSHYQDAVSITAIATSTGFSGSYTSTRAGRSTGPVALDGEIKRTAHYGTAARRFDELESLETVARVAARRATALFGARKPPTGPCTVIFERDVAAQVLDDVFGAVSAANVSVGNSWLIGRAGERVGSDVVTIVDDGRMPGKLGSSPFDGEGVATQRTVVFERGVLKSFLYDTYYARKLGAASTGSSTGSGIGTANFYLEPGAAALDDLIASTQRGVLVLDTIGFATEHASGTYSRGARGLFIERGEVTHAVDEFTIAGTYGEILAGIDAVANDLRFDSPVASPSFRVAQMTISGN